MEVPTAEMRLETELLSMIGRYGVESVHKALVNRMKKEYSYLKLQFEDKKKEEPIIKNEEPIIKNEEVLNNDEKIVEVKQDSKKFRNSKDVKEWQKVQEDTKSDENIKKGVLKKDLLTKDNLKKWIEEEGRTFSYIAREFIGCRDTEVSAAAKLWGISKKSK
jgi:hypothetical protein